MTTELQEGSIGLQPKDISDTLPLHKEEARQQFDYYTQLLNLKHTFTFDEVWETLLKKRFRKDIIKFEDRIKDVPGVLGSDPFPLVHIFSDGLYIRQITVPAQTLTITKIHKQEHVFFLLKGTISILTEEGVKKFTAPYTGITKPGTKRVIYHHDEVILTTVHATEEKDVERVEEQVIAKDFDEMTELEIKDFIQIATKEESCLL
jgi:hypothetical protein